MDISLTKPELRKFIEEQVRGGSFSSPAEVVEAGLERLMLDLAPKELDEETICSIERAEAEFDRGEDHPFTEVAAEFRRARPRALGLRRQGDDEVSTNA